MVPQILKVCGKWSYVCIKITWPYRVGYQTWWVIWVLFQRSYIMINLWISLYFGVLTYNMESDTFQLQLYKKLEIEILLINHFALPKLMDFHGVMENARTVAFYSDCTECITAHWRCVLCDRTAADWYFLPVRSFYSWILSLWEK